MKKSETHVYACDCCGKEEITNGNNPMLNCRFLFTNRDFSTAFDLCGECYPGHAPAPVIGKLWRRMFPAKDTGSKSAKPRGEK